MEWVGSTLREDTKRENIERWSEGGLRSLSIEGLWVDSIETLGTLRREEK